MTSPRFRLVSFCLAALFLLSPRIAEARPHKCAEITKGDKKACQLEADASCKSIKRTPERMRCEDKFFQKHYACWNGAFANACQPVEKKYWDVCRKAHELDTNRPASVKKFVDRALAYDATLAEYRTYHQEWNVCFGDDRKCQSTATWLNHCVGAKDKFKKTYATAVDHILRADVAQARGYITKTRRRGRNKFAINHAASTLAKVAMLQELAVKVPWLAHRADALVSAKKELSAQSAGAQKDLQAALAKRRCPRAKAPNRRLARQLMPAAKRFFHSTADAKIWVRALRLSGRKTTTYNRYQRVETQRVPAYVCTERKYLRKTSNNACAYFDVTLKRSRRVKGKWSPWSVAVGTTRDLLCKHVR